MKRHLSLGKKAISILLTFTLCFWAVPANAFATGSNAEDRRPITTQGSADNHDGNDAGNGIAADDAQGAEDGAAADNAQGADADQPQADESASGTQLSTNAEQTDSLADDPDALAEGATLYQVEDVLMLGLYGEATQDKRTAVDAVVEAAAEEETVELNRAEANKLVGDLFTTVEASAATAPTSILDLDYPRKGDGSDIESITIKWLPSGGQSTQDASYDVEVANPNYDPTQPEDPDTNPRTITTTRHESDALLYMEPSSDTAMRVKFQLDYALSGEHAYSPGDVTITIPAYIFHQRTANNEGTEASSKNPADHGLFLSPMLEAPNKRTDFNWQLVQDEQGNLNYVFTNTKRMAAASRGFIQFSISELTPHSIIDMSITDDLQATMQVTTHRDNTLALHSNIITAQVNTKQTLRSATKRVSTGSPYMVSAQELRSMLESSGQQIPADIAAAYPNESHYVIVNWYMYGYHDGNQPYTLEGIDTRTDVWDHDADYGSSVDAEGKPLNYHDGFLVYGAPAVDIAADQSKADIYAGNGQAQPTGEGNTLGTDARDLNVIQKGWFVNGTTPYSNVRGIFPLSQFQQDTNYYFSNRVDYRLTPIDEVDDPTYQSATARVRFSFSEPKWIEPTGHFNVFKWGNDNDYGYNDVDGYDKRSSYNPELTTHRLSSSTYTIDRDDIPTPGVQHLQGYYGQYLKALNELQGTQTQEAKDIIIGYTMKSEGWLLPWIWGGSLGDTPPATRVEENYGRRPVTMITEDTGLWVGPQNRKNSSFPLTVHDDYEFLAVDFVKPEIGKIKAINVNEDGSFAAMYSEDGTFEYQADYDDAKIPPIVLELQMNGSDEWVPYAIEDWSSGECVVTIPEGAPAGTVHEFVGGSSTTLKLPAGTDNFRTRVTSGNAYIWYYVRPIVQIKTTDKWKDLIEEAFVDSYNPTANVWNGVEMWAYEYNGDLGPMPTDGEREIPMVAEGDEELGNLIVDISKEGYDKLYGYTTDIAAIPSKAVRFDQSRDVDYETRTLTLHYSARVEERSVIADKDIYQEAMNDGILLPEESCVWYDLLPPGVTPLTGTIRLPRRGDTITNVRTIQNYKDSGRTLLVVEANLTPAPERYRDGDVYYYMDAPKIEFDASYTFEGIYDYGPDLHNVIVFESGNDELGSIEDYMGEANNPNGTNNIATANAWSSDPDEAALEKATLSGDWLADRTTNSFLYAGANATVDVLADAMTSIHKEVSVNNDGWYSQGLYYLDQDFKYDTPYEENVYEGAENRDVYEGGQYSYRIRMMSNSDTITRNMVIYDSLENFTAGHGNDGWDHVLVKEYASVEAFENATDRTPEEYDYVVISEDGTERITHQVEAPGDKVWSIKRAPHWRGILRNVDVSHLIMMGCSPVVYYSVADELQMQIGEGTQGAINPDIVLDNHIGDVWVRADQYTGSLSDVHAIAIDARQASTDVNEDGVVDENDEFTLQPLETAVVYFNMTAPTGSDAAPYIEANAHAYNNIYLDCLSIDKDSGISSGENFIRNDYTKVGLLENTIEARKVWDDDGNRDGVRPETATLTLFRNGQVFDPTGIPGFDGFVNPVVVSAEDADESGAWVHLFEHLPYADDNGDPIRWTVVENDADVPANYEASTTSFDDGHVFEITNTHEPEKTRVTGQKQWVVPREGLTDAEYADAQASERAARPASINVKLYADGSYQQQKTVKPAEDGTWSYEFNDLFKNRRIYNEETQAEETVPIEYTVEESAVPSRSLDSYNTSIEGDAENGYIITNTYHPYGNFELTKTVQNTTSVTEDQPFTFTIEFKRKTGTYTAEEADAYNQEHGFGPDDPGHVTAGDPVFEPDMGTYDYEIVDVATDERQDSGSIANNGTVQLQGGQKLKIAEIPESVQVSATETVPAGWTATNGEAQSVIVKPNATASLTAQNSYSTQGSLSLAASKTLTGRPSMQNYQFRFELYGENLSVVVPDGEERTVGLMKDGDHWVIDPYSPKNILFRTAASNTSGYAPFGIINYSTEDAGKTYRYYISEVDRGRGGYTYDKAIYRAEVEVVDNGDGTMTATPTYSKAEITETIDPDSGNPIPHITWVPCEDDPATDENEASLRFANEYDAEGQTTLRAWKQLEGGSIANYDEAFTFELLDEEGNIVSTASNNARGEATFEPITYTVADLVDEQGQPSFVENPDGVTVPGKVFTYAVREQKGSDPNITYSHEVFGYTVTVYDNGDGTLSCLQGLGTAHPVHNGAACEHCEGLGYKLAKVNWNVQIDSLQDLVNWGQEFDLRPSLNGKAMPRNASVSGFSSTPYCVAYGYAIPRDVYESAAFQASAPMDSSNSTIFDVPASQVGSTLSSYIYANYTPTSYRSELLRYFSDNGDRYGPVRVINVLDGAGPDYMGVLAFWYEDKPGATAVIEPCAQCEGHGQQVGSYYVDADDSASMPIFTNTMKPGALEVTKNIENPTEAPDSLFKFRLELENPDGTPLDTVIENATFANSTMGTQSAAGAASTSGVSTGTMSTQSVAPAASTASTSSASGAGTQAAAGAASTSRAGTMSTQSVAPAASTASTSGFSLPNPLDLFAPEKAYADEADDAGASGWTDWGDEVEWALDPQGGLWVRPKAGASVGVAPSLSGGYDDAPWYEASGTITSVHVPQGTKIKLGENVSYLFAGIGWNRNATIDLTGFDTSEVTNMSNMFYESRNLSSMTFGDSFDTSNVTDMSWMFFNCNNLPTLDLTGFNTSNVTDMNNMFNSCESITELTLGSGFNTSQVRDMGGMFNGCSRLTELDVSNFDTSQVTDMSYMFSTCTSLTSLEVSHFDTSNVTNMSSMFNFCSRLTELDVTNFVTSNVTNMSDMFGACTRLTELDVSHFDTSNNKSMHSMFKNCPGLSSLDVSNFDTSNVTSMYETFMGCSGLTELDVSNFDTSSVTTMAYMFSGCSGLTNLDLSSFDTPKVTNMSYMFRNCSGLTELDLSRFDTSKVTNMVSMFQGCTSLSSLDLSSFDTSKINTIYDMFRSCSSLETIYASVLFNVDHISTPFYHSNMFTGCDSLDGHNGTTFAEKQDVGKTYAKIDKAGQEGYFTATEYFRYYHSNDGTNNMFRESSKPEEDATTASANSFVSMYPFTGWNTEPDGSGTSYAADATIPARTYSVGDVVNLYAQWGPYEPAITGSNGVYEWEMPGNMTMHMPDLPAGTIYRVYEETPEGWVLVSQGNTSGAIEPLATAEASFTNRYQPSATSAVLNARKTLDGAAADAGAFTFVLQEVDAEGAPVAGGVSQTVANAGGGAITFEPILYEGAGTFYYTISEVVPQEGDAAFDPSIAYDTHVQNVTVTVTDDGAGNLSATVSYDGLEPGALPAFANETHPGSLLLQKQVEGTDDANKEFTFEIEFHDERGRLVEDQIEYYIQGGSDASASAGAGSNGLFGLSLPNPFELFAPEKAYAAEADVTRWETHDECEWGIDGDDTLWIRPKSGDSGEFLCTGGSQYGFPWYMFGDSITSVRVPEGKTIEFIGDMSYMFYSCDNLVSADLSGFDTSRVTDMSDMFEYCYALNSVVFGDAFDTSNVTDMAAMFNFCTSLTELDLSNFDTSSVENMAIMFAACDALESLDVSSFNTSNVTTMWYMFRDCHALTSLDLSSFDTSSVEDMQGMLQKCTALTELNLGSFDTSSATNMNYMFNHCSSLTSLDVSSFDTSNVETMYSMFAECSSLTELDLSSFVIPRVYDMAYMFGNCSNLQTIYATDSLTGDSVFNTTNQFEGCDSLAGAYGTAVSDKQVYDKTYARIDRPGQEGYYTGVDVYVVYLPNDGSNNSSADSADLNANILTKDPSQLGYAFRMPGRVIESWNTKPDGTGTSYEVNGIIPAGTIERGRALTLYAQWSDAEQGSVPYFVKHWQQPLSLSTDISDYVLADTDALSGNEGEVVYPAVKSYDEFRSPRPQSYTILRDGTYNYYYDRSQFRVVFDANGGEGTMNPMDFTGGIAQPLSPNAFTKDNDVFLYWNTEADGSGTVYANGQSVKNLAPDRRAAILYAQWASGAPEEQVPTNGKITVTLKPGQILVIPDLPAGTTYTITETDLPAGYTLAATDGTEGTIVADQGSFATVSNTYDATGGINLEAIKSMANGPLEAAQFSFELLDAEGNVVDVASNDANGNVKFDLIDYTLADMVDDQGNYVSEKTFTYTVREVRDSESPDYDPRVEYDTSEKTITVTVTDRGDGVLEAVADYAASDTDDIKPPAFVNAYQSYELKLSKELVGATAASEDAVFTFDVTLIGPDGQELEGEFDYSGSSGSKQGKISSGGTIELSGGESIVISGLPYGCTYEISERSKAGFTQAAALGATGTLGPDNPDASATFTNRYEAYGEAVVSVGKNLTGRPLDEGQFEFELRDDAGTVLQRTTNTADGKVNFAPIPFTQEDVGNVYTYQIVEVDAGDPGYTYAADPIDVSVRVIDNGDGTLDFDIKYGDAAEAAFDNRYESSGTATVEADKSLTGRPQALQEGEFSFKLVDAGGTEVGTATNTATGEVAISLDYTQEDMSDAETVMDNGMKVRRKAFTYTLSEVLPTDDDDATRPGVQKDGVTYDPAEYTVTVTVTDRGNGTLATSVAYTKANGDALEGDLPEFANTYTAPETTIELFAQKNLVGRDFEAGESFTFELAAASETTPMPTGAAEAQPPAEGLFVQKTVGSNAPVGFGQIEYTLADLAEGATAGAGGSSSKVFRYTITEVVPAAGDKKPGLSYDEETHVVLVTLTDDGQGNLSASAEYVGSETATAATLTNTYTANDVSFNVHAQKFMNDQPLSASTPIANTRTYTVDVYDADGALVKTSSAAMGKDTNPIQIDGIRSFTYDDLKNFVDHDDNPETPDEWDGTWAASKVFTYYLRERIPDGATSTAGGLTYAHGTTTLAQRDGHTWKTSDGVTYDSTPVVVTVTVTDMSGGVHAGQLTATVSYSPSSTAGEVPNTYEAAKFSNAYEATGTAELKVKKSFTGRDWVAGETFTVQLLEGADVKASVVAENGTDEFALAPALSYTLADLNGAVTKTFAYTLHEYVERPGLLPSTTVDANAGGGQTVAGITYAADKPIWVRVTDQGNGTLKCEYSTTSATTGFADTLSAQTIANTYETNDSKTVVLSATKQVLGTDGQAMADWGDFSGKTFNFRLKGTSANASAVNETKQATQAAPTAQFGTLTFTRPGTYTYEVRELSPAGTEMSSQVVDGGLVYDKTVHTVEVTITDKGDGTLNEPVVKVDGTQVADPASIPAISNREEGTDSVHLGATKTLSGRNLVNNEFTFELYKLSSAGSGNTLPADAELVGSAVHSNASGAITFPEITYTLEDMKNMVDGDQNPSTPDTWDGTYATTKSFYYAAKETSTSGNGVTVDSSIKYYTVVVENTGDHTVAVTSVTPAAGNPPVFANAYTSSGSATIHTNKNFTGDRSWNGDTFTFQLKDASSTVLDTKQATSADQVNFDALVYTQADMAAASGTGFVATKVVKYTIHEFVADPDDATVDLNANGAGGTFAKLDNGISYAADKDVWVKLTDNQQGTIAVEYSTTSATEGFATTLDQTGVQMTNRYDITKTVDVALQATKELQDKSGTADDDWKVGANDWSGKTFNFVLLSNDTTTPMPTGAANRNDATGKWIANISGATATAKTASFPAITYTRPGTYTYTIHELKDAADIAAGTIGYVDGLYISDGLVYSETGHAVTVVVADDGMGGLAVSSVTYGTSSATPSVFHNIEQGDCDIELRGKKALTGRPLEAGLFSFELFAMESTTDNVFSDAKRIDSGAVETAGVVKKVLQYNLDDLNGADSKTFYYAGREVIPAGAMSTEDGLTYGPDTTAAQRASHTWVKDGTTYSSAVHRYEVTVIKDGTAAAIDSVTINGTPVTLVDGVVPESAFPTHTNSYASEGTPALSVSKDFEGRAWKMGEQFTIQLKNAAGAVVDTVELSENELTKSFTLPGLTQASFGPSDWNGNTATKDFTYTLHEVAGSVSDDANAAGRGCTHEGITYPADKTVYVRATDNGSGTISFTYSTDGQDYSSELAAQEFDNDYAITGNVKAQLSATKAMFASDGTAMPATWKTDDNDFSERTFGFVLAAADATSIETMPATAIGGVETKQASVSASSVDFGQLTFTAPGTYRYTITEARPGDATLAHPVHEGLTYDTTAYNVEIVVADDGVGGLTQPVVKIGPQGQSLALGNSATFSNYEVGTDSIAFGATKAVTGMDMAKEAWSFNLYGADSSFAKAGNALQTVTANPATGAVAFAPIEYTWQSIADHTGAAPHKQTFYYVIEEAAGTNTAIDYSSKAVKVAVEVTETSPVSHTVEVTKVTVDGVDYEGAAIASIPWGECVFTNAYTAAGTAQIKARKTLTGRDFKAGDEFEFVLSGPNAGADNKKTVSDATEVTFNTLNFTEADFAGIPFEGGVRTKSYEYTVSETAGNLGGVTYAADQTVTVTLTDNGTGTITASYQYGDTTTTTPPTVEVVNAYAYDGTTTAQLGATKQLSGRAGQAGDVFEFVLEAGTATYTDGSAAGTSPMPAGAGAKTSINMSSAADGATSEIAQFGAITFTKPGTYSYVITEVVPADATNAAGTAYADRTPSDEGPWVKDGITYDASRRTATITVVDDLSGGLSVASVVYAGGANEGADPVPFVNRYDTTQTTASIEAQKSMIGHSILSGAFTLQLYASDASWTLGDPIGAARGAHASHATAAGAHGQFGAVGDITSETFIYAEVGTYYYIIREVIPATAVNATGQTYGTADAVGPWMLNGVTYDESESRITVTVTDVNPATGKRDGQLRASVSYNNATEGAYAGDESITDKAALTNTYEAAPAEATLQARKAIAGRPSGWSTTYDDGKYTFAASVSEDNVDTGFAKTGAPLPSDAAASPAATHEHATVSFAAIEFDRSWLEKADGTYATERTFTYQISENEHGVAGMSAASEAGTAKVQVRLTDDGAGKLHTAVSTLDTAVTTRPPVFTNTYDASGAASIKLSKTISGREWNEGEDSFSFSLVAVGDNAATAPLPGGAEPGSTVKGTATASGETVNLGDIHYTLADLGSAGAAIFTYRLTEDDTTIAGIAKDPSVYTITITVTDSGTGTLTCQKNISHNSEHYTGGEVLPFVNTYTAAPTDATIEGAKTYNRVIEDGQFSFELYEADANFAVAPGAQPIDTTTAAAGTGTFAFDAINYDEPGTFYYVVREVVPAQTAGIAYDTHDSQVTVTVTDVANGVHTGQLAATVGYDDGNKAAFSNEYHAMPTTATLKATKTLNGRSWDADETFEFTLSASAGTPLPAAADCTRQATEAAATVEFGTIEFTDADMADAAWVDGMRTKDFFYQIDETNGGSTIAGTAYDTAKFARITVVDDGEGSLDVAGIDYSADGEVWVIATAAGASFVNTYSATEAKATIQGAKAYNMPIAADAFTFALYTTDESFDVADGVEPLQTKPAAAGTGAFAFDELTFTEPGTFYYVVREVVPQGADAGAVNGITYDTHDVQVTITVTDVVEGKHTGTLTAKVAYADAGAETAEATDASFENTYDAMSSATIFVEKHLEGRPWTTEDSFDFSMVATGANAAVAPMPAGTEPGEVATLTISGQDAVEPVVREFETINYKLSDLTQTDSEGTRFDVFTYEVRETSTAGKGITPDARVYTVTVNVVDKGDGTLDVQQSFAVDDAGLLGAERTEFVNVYEAEDVSVVLEGLKVYNRNIEAGQFSFELFETGEDFALASGAQPLASASAAAGTGAFAFDAITYNQAGTYYYVAREVVPDGASAGAVNGITYDTHDARVVVTVSDVVDGEYTGQMVATVVYETTTNSEVGTVNDKVVFVNTFNETPPPDDSTDDNDPPHPPAPNEEDEPDNPGGSTDKDTPGDGDNTKKTPTPNTSTSNTPTPKTSTSPTPRNSATPAQVMRSASASTKTGDVVTGAGMLALAALAAASAAVMALSLRRRRYER